MNFPVTVIQPSAVLNGAQAKEVRQEIMASLAAGARTVLLNLQSITFIDSSGLGELVIALKAVRAEGNRLCFCSVGEQPRLLFELTGMDQLFEIFADQAAFDQMIASPSEVG